MRCAPARDKSSLTPIRSAARSAVTELLNNITWHTLAGDHAKYSVGTARARKYARGFSPIAGFAQATEPTFDDLAPYCEPGDHFYCSGWTGDAPAGWKVDVDSTMHLMVWDAPPPDEDEALAAVPLRPEHVPQIVALVELTQPGPFGPRTPELGDYFGVFDGERLVAMAGERMSAAPLREVSGVCTHPDFQGRGFARRLVNNIVRRQLWRDEIPFLHVMHANARARGVYERMGFRDHLRTAVRVVSRTRAVDRRDAEGAEGR
jgi:ribosomal protein S18 acetylase RimI-like enzyme